MKQKIAIFGAGDLGREIFVLIQQINEVKEKWEFIGFFDDDPNKGKRYFGLPVLGNLKALNEYPDKLSLIVGIGATKIKEKIFRDIKNQNIDFPQLIHPSVLIEDYQKIKVGSGTVICAGNILTHNINIGNQVLINLACTVGHDCIINDFASIMPGTNISGSVIIDKGAYIGTGTKILNSISIGNWAVIGAGAVVNNNIEKGSTAVGVPARVIKYNE